MHQWLQIEGSLAFITVALDQACLALLHAQALAPAPTWGPDEIIFSAFQ